MAFGKIFEVLLEFFKKLIKFGEIWKIRKNWKSKKKLCLFTFSRAENFKNFSTNPKIFELKLESVK